MRSYLQHGRRHMPGGTDPIPDLATFTPNFAWAVIQNENASAGATVWDFDVMQSDSFDTVFGNIEDGHDPDLVGQAPLWILKKGLYLATLRTTWEDPDETPPFDYPEFDEKGNRFDSYLSIGGTAAANNTTTSDIYAPVGRAALAGSATVTQWQIFTVDRWSTFDEEDEEVILDAEGHVAIEVTTEVGLVGEPEPDPRDFSALVHVYRLADLAAGFGPDLPDVWSGL